MKNFWLERKKERDLKEKNKLKRRIWPPSILDQIRRKIKIKNP
jgi:hypothetical protein